MLGVHADGLCEVGTDNDGISEEAYSGGRVLVRLLEHSPGDSQVDRVGVLRGGDGLPLLGQVEAGGEGGVQRELDLPDEGELLVEPGVLLPRRERGGGVPAKERRDEARGLGLDGADGRGHGLGALVRDLGPGRRDEAGKVLVGREDGVGGEAAEELCELAGAVDDDLGGEVPREVLLGHVRDHAGGVEERQHVVEPQEVAVAAEAVEGLVVAEALRVDGVHDEAAPLASLRLGIGYLNLKGGAGLVVNLGNGKSLKSLELFGYRFVHSIFVLHVFLCKHKKKCVYWVFVFFFFWLYYKKNNNNNNILVDWLVDWRGRLFTHSKNCFFSFFFFFFFLFSFLISYIAVYFVKFFFFIVCLS